MDFQQTQNIWVTLVQRRPNVFDAGPTLYKHYTKVLYLLGWSNAGLTFHSNRAASVRLISLAGEIGGGGGGVSDPGLPRDMCLDHVIVASVLWCVVTRLPVLQVRPRVDHYTTTTVTTTRRFVTTHGLLKVNQGPAWNTRNSHLASTDPDPCKSIQVREQAGPFTLSSLSLPLPSSSTTSRESLSQLSTCCGWRWYLKWWGSEENWYVFVKQFHGNLHSKAPL